MPVSNILIALYCFELRLSKNKAKDFIFFNINNIKYLLYYKKTKRDFFMSYGRRKVLSLWKGSNDVRQKKSLDDRLEGAFTMNFSH